jgi:hypothetical protein
MLPLLPLVPSEPAASRVGSVNAKVMPAAAPVPVIGSNKLPPGLPLRSVPSLCAVFNDCTRPLASESN